MDNIHESNYSTSEPDESGSLNVICDLESAVIIVCGS